MSLVRTFSESGSWLLVKGEDATFQNKVHLAMQAKGFSDSKEQAPK